MATEADPPAAGARVCPACDGRLYPRELACADCGLLVRTRYRASEFLELDDDGLHLLRIFIACEGRLGDMARALGVSHPTVKARVKALRETLGFDAPPAPEPRPAAPQPSDALDRLEAGEIDFDEAMRLIEEEQ